MTTFEPPTGPAPPVPVDPRIRARRIEVRRSAGRRRLQRLAEAGAVLGIGLLFTGALFTPMLDVDGVRVTGSSHLAPEAIRAAAAIDPGTPLVSVDLGEVGARVAALPWVEEVTVHRRLDGEVELAITERTPVASAAAGVGVVLLDADGRVLGPAADAPDAPVVELLGLTAVPEPGGFVAEEAVVALTVAERLAAVAPGAVVSIEVGELQAALAQGGAVRFGDARQLDAKLRSLQTVLDQVDLTCLAVIDVQLPGSPVLTREEGCS